MPSYYARKAEFIFRLVARQLFLCFPESSAKEKLRRIFIKLTNSAPDDLVVRKGDTVVLVGATPGGEYLRVSKLVGEKGCVVAIEPETGNLEGLREEIKIKNLTNVTVVPKAAYSQKSELNLLVSDRPLDHKIAIQDVVHDNDLRQGAYISAERIEADTVDNILREIGIEHVDFVKIAVNGAEFEVLKGMEKTLEEDVKLWVKGHALMRGEPINKVIVPFLKDKGFLTQTVGGGTAPVTKDFVRLSDVYASGKIKKEGKRKG